MIQNTNKETFEKKKRGGGVYHKGNSDPFILTDGQI